MILEMFIVVLTLVRDCKTREETFLENFDLRILQELKHPIPTNGKQLYQNMLQYYSDLLDMFNMVKNNNSKVKTYVRSLITQGGPKILRFSFNLTQLEVTYSWSKEQTTGFNSVLSEVKNLWNKIEHTLPPEVSDSESDNYSYSDGSSDGGSYDWI